VAGAVSCALVLVLDLDEETMNQFDKRLEADTNTTQSGHGARRFAFIQSGWHREIVDRGRDAFLMEMERRGVPRADIDLFSVPGAFELPLHAQRLARTGRYSAIVACGFVVDGGIYRHEFVASAVINALMTVQLETDVPVISAVLTPHHFHSHEEHQKVFAEHFLVKGAEAASACLDTVAALAALHDLCLSRG
jgi:6,7-dimethyl-8-ribityllumazine synthase